VDQFFRLIEHVSYAPQAGGITDGRATVDLAARIVRDLERQRGLAERFGTTRQVAGVALAVGLLGLSTVVVATDMGAERGPATRFFEANALYKAGRYAEAAQGYATLLASGFESGALHYNLGNALFKAGELGRAVLSYERARRLLPRDPDVRANLRFAYQQVNSGAAGTPPQPPLWVRIALPLASHASTGELAIATSALYAVVMILLTLRLFLPQGRRALGRVAAAVAVVALITGTALGYRLVDEHVRTTAVIVRAGEIPVRFEPSENGTVHFTLSEGALVRRLAERDGWYQIRRSDGRRGWVEADSVEVL
jgi:tetratricopeptide (TPR) repeat protein